MQVQKKEIRQDIIDAAEYEFLKKGYQASSLRVIAKRANTTIGNLYNYYKNKEALLDAIIGSLPEDIENIFYDHQKVNPSMFDIDFNNMEQLSDIVEIYIPKLFRFDLLLTNAVVILLEGCENTKYASFQQNVYQVFYEHMLEHMEHISEENFPGKQLYIHTIVSSMLNAVIYIAKNKSSYEEGKNVLIQYIKFMIIGLLSTKDMVIDFEGEKSKRFN